jgi:transcriptional regulator with XRE-family HTH domain
MPRGKVDHPAVARLRELANERSWSKRSLARHLGINHSLITRALAGHPVTQTSAGMIDQGINRLRERERPRVDVAFATELLRLFQEALLALEKSEKAANPKD